MEEGKNPKNFNKRLKLNKRIIKKTIVVITVKTIKIIKLSRGRNIQKH